MKYKISLLSLLLLICISFVSQAEVKDKPVSKMEIISNPTYPSDLGGLPDLTGLRVRVTFIDGEEYIATAEDFTVERYDPTQEGSQLVAIRYGNYPTQLALTVRRSVLRRVNFQITNKIRYVGDSLTCDDFTAKAIYDSGKTVDVKDFNVSINKLTGTANNVTLSYEDYSETVIVYAQENTCTCIKVVNPGKSEFRVNEDFTVGDLKVEATYKNGSVVDVTDKCEVESPNMSMVGRPYVNIKFDSKSTSYQVSVSEFKFDRADMSRYEEEGVAVLYFKDKENPIEVRDTVWHTDDNTTGERTYTIHYAGEVYTAKGEIPLEDRRYVGTLKVRAQVPVGINVVSDDNGVLGYVSRTELQNLGDTDVRLNITMSEVVEQLSGVPASIVLSRNARTLFGLDIRNEKVYDIKTEYFRPFIIKLEVPSE